ncbi:MAG: ATP-binding cassette domain-containing protein [Gammaproteobacteria bacterium]
MTKRYQDNCVVNGLNLSIKQGTCFGLLGPNGAGKTTTLRMMLGMTEADSGELTLFGYAIKKHARELRSLIGVVPQMDNLDPDFTVAENLKTYASYFGLTGKSLEHKVEELLEFSSLSQKADVKIDTLSGGMKRRLTLARALINDPKLIILDEPTTGLDPQARHIIWQKLRELLSKDITLILTTHYMDEAERLCDELVIMDSGVVLAEGSPREMISSHIEPQVLELYGPDLAHWLQHNKNKLPGRVEYVGETVLCYVNQTEQQCIDDLMANDGIFCSHRRTNLEDVFLQLTGRDLRE